MPTNEQTGHSIDIVDKLLAEIVALVPVVGTNAVLSGLLRDKANDLIAAFSRQRAAGSKATDKAARKAAREAKRAAAALAKTQSATTESPAP